MSVSVFSPKTAGRESGTRRKTLAPHANVYSYTLAALGPRRERGTLGGAVCARGADANFGKFISSASSNGAVIKAFFIF